MYMTGTLQCKGFLERDLSSLNCLRLLQGATLELVSQGLSQMMGGQVIQADSHLTLRTTIVDGDVYWKND